MAASGDSLVDDMAVTHDRLDLPGRGRIAIAFAPSASEDLPRVAAFPARADAEV